MTQMQKETKDINNDDKITTYFRPIIDIFQVDGDNLQETINCLQSYANTDYLESYGLNRFGKCFISSIVYVRRCNLLTYRYYFEGKSSMTVMGYIKGFKRINNLVNSKKFENSAKSSEEKYLYKSLKNFLKGYAYILKGIGASYFKGAAESFNIAKNSFFISRSKIDDLIWKLDKNEKIYHDLVRFKKIVKAFRSLTELIKYSREIQLSPYSDIEKYKYKDVNDKIDETYKYFNDIKLNTLINYNQCIILNIWSKFLLKKIDKRDFELPIEFSTRYIENLRDIDNLCRDGIRVHNQILNKIQKIDPQGEIIKNVKMWRFYFNIKSLLTKVEFEINLIYERINGTSDITKQKEYRQELFDKNKSLKHYKQQIEKYISDFMIKSLNDFYRINDRMNYLIFYYNCFFSKKNLSQGYFLSEFDWSKLDEDQIKHLLKLIEKSIFSSLLKVFTNFNLFKKILSNLLEIVEKSNSYLNDLKKFLRLLIQFGEAYHQSTPISSKKTQEYFISREICDLGKYNYIGSLKKRFIEGILYGKRAEFTGNYQAKINFLDKATKVFKSLSMDINNQLNNEKNNTSKEKNQFLKFFNDTSKINYNIHEGWRNFYRFMDKENNSLKSRIRALNTSIKYISETASRYRRINNVNRYLIYKSRKLLFKGFLRYYHSIDLSKEIKDSRFMLTQARSMLSMSNLLFIQSGLEKYARYCKTLIHVINIDSELYSIIISIREEFSKGQLTKLHDLKNRILKAKETILRECELCKQTIDDSSELVGDQAGKIIIKQKQFYNTYFEIKEINPEEFIKKDEKKIERIISYRFKDRYLNDLEDIKAFFEDVNEANKSVFISIYQLSLNSFISRLRYIKSRRESNGFAAENYINDFENYIKKALDRLENEEENLNFYLFFKSYLLSKYLLFSLESGKSSLIYEAKKRMLNFVKKNKHKIKKICMLKEFLINQIVVLKELNTNSAERLNKIINENKIETEIWLLQMLIIIFPIPPLTFGFERLAKPTIELESVYQSISIGEDYYQFLINFHSRESRGNYEIKEILLANEDIRRYNIDHFQSSYYTNYKKIKNFIWRGALGREKTKLEWPKLILVKLNNLKYREELKLNLIIKLENLEDPNKIITWECKTTLPNRKPPTISRVIDYYSKLDCIIFFNAEMGSYPLSKNLKIDIDLDSVSAPLSILNDFVKKEFWKKLCSYFIDNKILHENIVALSLDFLNRESKSYNIYLYTPSEEMKHLFIREHKEIDPEKIYLPFFVFFSKDIEYGKKKNELKRILRNFYKNFILETYINIYREPRKQINKKDILFKYIYVDYSLRHVLADRSRNDPLTGNEKNGDFLHELIRAGFHEMNGFYLEEVIEYFIDKGRDKEEIGRKLINLKENGLIFPIET